MDRDVSGLYLHLYRAVFEHLAIPQRGPRIGRVVEHPDHIRDVIPARLRVPHALDVRSKVTAKDQRGRERREQTCQVLCECELLHLVKKVEEHRLADSWEAGV